MFSRFYITVFVLPFAVCVCHFHSHLASSIIHFYLFLGKCEDEAASGGADDAAELGIGNILSRLTLSFSPPFVALLFAHKFISQRP